MKNKMCLKAKAKNFNPCTKGCIFVGDTNIYDFVYTNTQSF